MPNEPQLQGWFPLPQRTRILLTGSDRIRYLNGQITNQVEGLAEGQSRYAVITNHKGQIEADLHYAHDPTRQGLVIDAHISLQESLVTRLDRYIIADDVTLQDITDESQAIHVVGGSTEAPPPLSHLEASGTLLLVTNRFGVLGWDLWLPSALDRQPLTDTLPALGFPQLTTQAVESHRIARGIPAWGHELTPGLLPPEARLENRAIHYQKGCYIGQEVISRMKSAGKVNRLLVTLQTEPNQRQAIPTLPQPLWLDQPSTDPHHESGKPIGSYR